MPSINSIDGLGRKAADSIEEAAKAGKFPLQGGFPEQNEGQ